MTDVAGFPNFQVSIMVGPLQTVVRGDEPEQFAKDLESMAALVPLIDALGEKVNPPKEIPPQQAAQYENQVSQQLGGQVISRTCPHGQMRYKEGMNRFNKPYKKYDCPNRVCDTIWEN